MPTDMELVNKIRELNACKSTEISHAVGQRVDQMLDIVSRKLRAEAPKPRKKLTAEQRIRRTDEYKSARETLRQTPENIAWAQWMTREKELRPAADLHSQYILSKGESGVYDEASYQAWNRHFDSLPRHAPVPSKVNKLRREIDNLSRDYMRGLKERSKEFKFIQEASGDGTEPEE